MSATARGVEASGSADSTLGNSLPVHKLSITSSDAGEDAMSPVFGFVFV